MIFPSETDSGWRAQELGESEPQSGRALPKRRSFPIAGDTAARLYSHVCIMLAEPAGEAERVSANPELAQRVTPASPESLTIRRKK